MALTIIVLGGIASIVLAAHAASLLVQSASATTDDVMNTTTSSVGGGGGQEAVSSTTNTTNNVSNGALGSLFSFGEGTEATVNPINETYCVISYSSNRIIMPPNTTGVVINSTETGNLTVNL